MIDTANRLPVLTVVSVLQVAVGDVIGFFAPGPRTVENLISTWTVRGIHMEPVWDGPVGNQTYRGQRVTLSYYGDKTPTCLRGDDTVATVA